MNKDEALAEPLTNQCAEGVPAVCPMTIEKKQRIQTTLPM